ncbi:MAG: helix-turn-helix transcriptional regulator [Trebonia sp.]
MAQLDGRQPWVFLSNHARVLLCIARDRDTRTRDIADQVGITERAAQRLVSDLIAEGYITRTKVGRRNRYQINHRSHLRTPSFQDLEIGRLLDLLNTNNQSLQPERSPSKAQRTPRSSPR